MNILKLIKTKNAKTQSIAEYAKPTLTETSPDAIGLFFVLVTFLSKSLSAISFMIHPAELRVPKFCVTAPQAYTKDQIV